MPEHSTDPGDMGCSHGCAESVALAYSFSKLITAALDLIDIQHGLDPTTWPLSQALTYCKAYVDLHPSVTARNLIAGIDTNAEAIADRVRWETPPTERNNHAQRRRS